jgi:radical SAM superfamily enzyme YgiQ (UPF0313 family)
MGEIRTVLVNPPHTLKERYGGMRAAGNTMPALGLLQLAAGLKKAGGAVHVVDAPARGLGFDRALRELLARDPAVVGMTAFTPSVANAARLAAMIRNARPGLPIILGGPHVSAVPEETVRRFPVFTAGVIGEGDERVTEVSRRIAQGDNDLSGIPGLVINQGGSSRAPKTGASGNEGDIIRTPGEPALVQDLDSLPFPAWDLAPGFPSAYSPAAHTYRRLPAATMFTTRGCPEQCAFCDRSVFGNAVRAHSAEYVVEQMALLADRFGVRDITIYDDAFPLLKPRLMRICELIRKRGLDLTWSCNSRAGLADPEVLKAMKAAGCWQIGYGIESGDQGILDRIKKRLRLEEIERAVRITEEAGIRTKGFFMIGHPGETPGTILRTIEFAKRLPLSDYQTCFFTPFPGTSARAEAGKWGTLENDWSRMNLLYPVFVPTGLTREELAWRAARSYREFYLRPRILLRYLAEARNPGRALKILRGGSALVTSLASAWLGWIRWRVRKKA